MTSPRWKCPHCGGTDVQVSYPTWYHETNNYELKMVETDSEADVLWWYCEACDQSDSGEPVTADGDEVAT